MSITLPDIKPMLASPPKSETLPTLVGTHTFDIKLDGVRALLYWDGSTCRLVNRSGIDVSHRFPEVCQSAATTFDTTPVVLDGEVVAASGSFQDTAKRDKQNKPGDVIRTMAEIPVMFIAFDVLWIDSTDLRTLPYVTRRHDLDLLVRKTLGPDSCIAASVISEDPAFFDTIKSMGMEGVIAKRNTSTYRSGRFSDWIKFKTTRSITCVAIGYEAGTGARAHFGAMHLALVGHPNGGGIVEVGRVGTGFDASEIAYLKGEMDAGRVVVVEIECLNKSRDNKLRFPVYKGLRTDLSVVDAKLSQLDDIPTM